MLTRWSEPYLYLTTVGRRTGQPHRIEIWFDAWGQTSLAVVVAFPAEAS